MRYYTTVTIHTEKLIALTSKLQSRFKEFDLNHLKI